MMKVLVTGGRAYANAAKMDATLGAFLDAHGHDNLWIIQGGADGADKLARAWAYANAVTLTTEPARWKLHKRAAGVLRNKRMLKLHRPDVVLAFPGGRGTAHMVEFARANHVPVTQVE